MNNINLYARKKEYYRYSTDDFALSYIGLGSWTKPSLENFFTPPLNPDILEFFGSNLTDTLLGLDATLTLMSYDTDAQKYRKLSGWGEIKTLNPIKYPRDKFTEPEDENVVLFFDSWEKVQLGLITESKAVKGYEAVAHRIQNSKSGCIEFDANLTILNEPRVSKIKIYILSYKDNESSRVISFNGSPVISGPPTTGYGTPYAHGATAALEDGAYAGLSPNYKQPSDQVAGKLRLAWNPAINSWESGTQQILARLVTNIDAVNIPPVPATGLLSVPRSEAYSPDSPFMGKPEKGTAIPLSTENGNSYQFGPDYFDGCDDTSKPTTITVTNRTPRAYSAGTLVICSYIGGEWIIISGEGELKKSQTISFGRFEYQQYIIPANLFFTNSDGALLYPDSWKSKIRSDYYYQAHDKSAISDLEMYMNAIAGTIPSDYDNPRQFLTDKLLSDDTVSDVCRVFVSNKYIDANENSAALAYFTTNYCDTSKVFTYKSPLNESEYAVPKNILVRSNRTLNLGLSGPPESEFGSELDALEVPFFWGLLFCDGYKSAQALKYKTLLKDLTIHKDDPNLRELSCGATTSFPYIYDDQITLQFLFNNTEKDNDNANKSSLVDLFSTTTKGGGWYKPVSIYKDDLSFDKLDKIIANGKILTGNTYFKPIDYAINSLEPTNPSKIQFSPMTVDFLYFGSTFAGDADPILNPWGTLKKYQSFLKSLEIPAGAVGSSSKSYKAYYDHLLSNSETIGRYYETILGVSSTYNIFALQYKKSFGLSLDNVDINTVHGPIITRHPAPLGVVDRNRIVPQTFNYRRRSPCVPIIAVKSTVKTTSNGLSFTIPQYFGHPSQGTVTGGQGPNITILPMGGGVTLGWNTQVNPVQYNSIPTWGDSMRIDGIDSFGTTTLHAKVYEHWPEQQTIFLGPIYTVLHFNPSAEDEIYTYSIDNAKKIVRSEPKKDMNGNNVKNVSSVDFREPCIYELDDDLNPKIDPETKDVIVKKVTIGTKIEKKRKILEDGITVKEVSTLAQFSDWIYNTKRRAKLLSGGGFGYLRTTLYVDSVNVKVGFQGSGYKDDETFSLPDGTTFQVKTFNVGRPGEPDYVEGAIDRIHNLVSNTQEKNKSKIIKNVSIYNDITSNNIQPSYTGAGSGARFDIILATCYIAEYDAPPRYVGQMKRLTSPSNYGKGDGNGRVNRTNSASITFSETTKREFDIFYFFQNDPTSYGVAVDGVSNLANFVIAEVNTI